METFKVVLIAGATGFTLGASLTAWLVRYLDYNDNEKKTTSTDTSVTSI